MGIAANQARVFLLTSRDHDLTLNGNQITQKRLLLATSQEDIASRYARKTGNKQMMFSVNIQMGQTNQLVERNLTYSLLKQAGTGDSNQNQYRVKNLSGEIVVGSFDDIKGSNIRPNPDGTYTANDSTGKSCVYRISSQINDQSENNNYLQEGLRNGQFYIESLVKSQVEGEGASWQSTGWAGDPNFRDTSYTADDDRAKAEYDAAIGRVQVQDKRLEAEQKSIETQHKAVTTEKESVVKLTMTNTEKGFKVFSA